MLEDYDSKSHVMLLSKTEKKPPSVSITPIRKQKKTMLRSHIYQQS